MNVFNEFLSSREARESDAWIHRDRVPEDRLLKFDTWSRRELATRLLWPPDMSDARKLLEQCRVELERLVIGLWKRGWMLDGRNLAGHIIKALDDVGAAQRAGRVADFWPFYRSCVNRYVGLNAEEIRDQALRAGAHVNQALDRLGIAVHSAPTLPELITQRRQETLHDRLTRLRRSQARKTAEKAQLALF